MPGRTLRDAIAVALEVVPSVELAAGDEASRAALRGFLLGWIKEYAFSRGVILEDGDLELELRETIAHLRGVAVARTKTPAVVVAPLDPLQVHCWICNAQPGGQCTSITDASKYREPHAQRVELAQKGQQDA